MTNAERRNILNAEYRKALGGLIPKGLGGKYSGAQIAAAKGIAKKRALAIIDGQAA